MTTPTDTLSPSTVPHSPALEPAGAKSARREVAHADDGASSASSSDTRAPAAAPTAERAPSSEAAPSTAPAREDRRSTSRVTSSLAPRRLVEPTSPFLGAVEPAAPLKPRRRTPPLLLTILRDPRAVLARMSTTADVQRVVVASLSALAACAIVLAFVVVRGEALVVARSAGLLVANLLLALAASIGPIYATAIVVAARVPIARLVVVLLCSTAAGAMVLVAASFAPWFLLSVDREWLGPVSLVGVFVLAGLAAGFRLHSTLVLFAIDAKGAALDEDELARVGALARVASVIIASNVALALWGFDALVS